MNAYEVLGIEYAVFVLDKSRDKLEWSIAAAGRFGNLKIWNPGNVRYDDKLTAYLTRRVDYLRREVLTAVPDDLAECILDGGIVAVHEVSIHELHCERGFA